MDEVFTTQARRCKRCGRILVSEEGLALGYGCTCWAEQRREENRRRPLEGQMALGAVLGESGGENEPPATGRDMERNLQGWTYG